MSVTVPQLVDELDAVTARVRERFGRMSADELNWKERLESWSVAQCLEHLIKINSAYFDDLDDIIRGKTNARFLEKYSPLSGFFGRLLYKRMTPESEQKLTAPTLATPAASDIPATIVEDFALHQAELAERMSATEEFNLEKIIITSPFIRLITYSLLDAYRIMVVHEQRHLQQAERVAASPRFPTAMPSDQIEKERS